MADVVEITVLDIEGGHEDLIFCVPGLTARLSFDTYYFALAIEPYEDRTDVKRFIGECLENWITEVRAMDAGDVRYLPIDISDQYVGCLCLRYTGSSFEMNYGFSRIHGHSLDMNNLHQYFKNVSDFRSDIPTPLIVERIAFINSLSQQAAQLKVCRNT